MPQWKNTNDAANSVNYGAHLVKTGSGNANSASNNTALFNNTTIGAFLSNNASVAEGQFGVSKAQMANTSGESGAVTHAGWTLRTQGTGGLGTLTVTAGGSSYVNLAHIDIQSANGINAFGLVGTNSTGGITSVTILNTGAGFVNVASTTTTGAANGIASFTVTAAGAGFNNGDVITVSNGTFNAHATVTTNATGNIASAALSDAGRGFSNSLNSVVVITAANGSATGNGISAAAVGTAGGGYNNTDTVVFSNGTVNATATLTTNTAGNLATITMTNVGSGFNGSGNTKVTFLAANGSPSAGTLGVLTPTFRTGTLTVTVGAGSGATFAVTLGGRAGRVNYETLVAMSSIAAGAGSNSTQLPQ